MSVLRKIFFFSIIVGMLMSSGFADTFSHQTEINDLQSFVKSGAEYIKKNGKVAAFKEINDPNGRFRKNNVYLFVYNYDGICLAHGADAKNLLGKNLYDFRDQFGTPVIKLIVKLAKIGGGFVHYYWPAPDTKNIQLKTTYIMPVDDDVFIGAGIYKRIDVPVLEEVKIEELKSLVNAGVEYIRQHGEIAAFKEFSDANGAFRNGEAHIFVYGKDGEVVVSDTNDKTVPSTNDEFGNSYFNLFREAVRLGGGVVSYYFLRPDSKTIFLKINYVKPLNEGRFIGAAFYAQ